MSLTATYSPEDNKLRIYPDGTRVDSLLDEDEYKEFKAAGFKWAAKQECFVCPRWTPEAEDWCIDLAGEVGDEDYSMTERSADRAERFGDYRDKREGEAEGHADNFEAGPMAFGHQNQARAERKARRHDRYRTHAVSQWGKAEYWQHRTAGVISHALHRADPGVRRGRILRLEADQRKQQASLDKSQKDYDTWKEIATMEGADVPIVDGTPMNAAQKKAYYLANSGHSWWHTDHPTCEAANVKAKSLWRHGFSAYDLLAHEDTFLGEPFERLSPKQLAELYLDKVIDPATPGTNSHRWRLHYELRLTYEKAMLENEGGMAGDVEMEVGGWIGNHQIHKVNKSVVTGRVVSVTLRCKGDRWGNSKEGHHMRAFNIERMPEGAYRAPTEDEKESFTTANKERKAEAKAKAPPKPPLINPTDEDAAKLQLLFNREDKKPSEVLRMTQAQYSARSKGTSPSYCTVPISEKGKLMQNSHWRQQKVGRVPIFEVRRGPGEGWDGSPRVIILTDKPQKPIPWDVMEQVAATMPNAQTVFPTLGKLAEVMGNMGAMYNNKENQQLLLDAVYIGWAYDTSASQQGFTQAGIDAYKRWRDQHERKPEPRSEPTVEPDRSNSGEGTGDGSEEQPLSVAERRRRKAQSLLFV